MGSFDFTCAISGLPISSGHKVRYLLLTQSPYDSTLGCYIHDHWFPRVFPLRGEYNDYGSVEKVEDGAARALWFDGLQQDLVETGWGDNSAHDVPTKKNMTWDQLLTAVWEGRVEVQKEWNRGVRKPTSEAKLEELLEKETPKGVPTLRRVQAALKKAGFPVMEPEGEGFMVNEEEPGRLRIRWHSYGEGYGKDETKLAEIQKCFPDYATMLLAGSGSYASAVDLMVAVKPGTKTKQGHPFTYHRIDEKKAALPVRQAMIREDVWQELLKLKLSVETYAPKYERVNATIAWFQKELHTYWKDSLKRVEELKNLKDIDLATRFVLMESTRDSVAGSLVGKDVVPFTVGLGTNWKLMVEKFLAGGVTQKEVDPWIDDCAEFVFVQHILMETRYWWRPSFSGGPQCGEYGLHGKVNKLFSEVANRINRENR